MLVCQQFLSPQETGGGGNFVGYRRRKQLVIYIRIEDVSQVVK